MAYRIPELATIAAAAVAAAAEDEDSPVSGGGCVLGASLLERRDISSSSLTFGRLFEGNATGEEHTYETRLSRKRKQGNSHDTYLLVNLTVLSTVYAL